MTKRYFFPALFLLAVVVVPATAFAAFSSSVSCDTPGADPNTCIQGGASTLSSSANVAPQNGGSVAPPQNGGSPASYSVSANPGCPSTGCTVQNPLGSSSFCGLIKNLLQAAIAIGIPVAVLFIVYAGFKFVLARGSPEKLKEARQNFMWTLIGIAIFLGAWLLANVIANTVNALGGQQSIISCN